MKRRHFFWLAGGLGVLALPACAGGTDAEPAPTPTPTPAPDDPTPTPSPLPMALALVITTDKAKYTAGEPVRFTLTLRNAGAAAELHFRDGQRFDIRVADPRGPAWRWAEGRIFTQALGTETIPAGGSITFDAAWDQRRADGQPADPGNYVALAEIVSEGITPIASSSFEIAAATPVRGATIVGSGVGAWSEPRTSSTRLRSLAQGEPVVIQRTVSGEAWVIAGQTWEVAEQDWQDRWYELVGGGFVYAAWVYVPAEGERHALDVPAGKLQVQVDPATNALAASVDGAVIYRAKVTTGKPGYETPPGEWTVNATGRIEDERMTSAGSGYPDSERYDVQHVLFTQYFTGAGHALHLNYWRPLDYFGAVSSSHGCVGLLLHDAQWLWLAGYAGMPVQVLGPGGSVSGANTARLRPGGP